MENKGLCETCENDKKCVFQTRFPILQCEEFAGLNHRISKVRQARQRKGKYLEEVTTEE